MCVCAAVFACVCVRETGYECLFPFLFLCLYLSVRSSKQTSFTLTHYLHQPARTGHDNPNRGPIRTPPLPRLHPFRLQAVVGGQKEREGRGKLSYCYKCISCRYTISPALSLSLPLPRKFFRQQYLASPRAPFLQILAAFGPTHQFLSLSLSLSLSSHPWMCVFLFFHPCRYMHPTSLGTQTETSPSPRFFERDSPAPCQPGMNERTPSSSKYILDRL